MRKNYFLKDVVTKAKCFGFTNEEIMNAVREGINEYEQVKKSIKNSTKTKKEGGEK